MLTLQPIMVLGSSLFFCFRSFSDVPTKPIDSAGENLGGFMKEFLSIGELAKIFDMDVQLLRHYDAKGLLVPQVRNSENSRRFYHFDQVYPLATIRYLRRLGYPLARIRDFLHNNALRDNLEMLSEQAEKLRRQCDELNATIQIIQQKVEFIDREQSSSQRGKFSTFWLWIMWIST